MRGDCDGGGDDASATQGSRSEREHQGGGPSGFQFHAGTSSSSRLGLFICANEPGQPIASWMVMIAMAVVVAVVAAVVVAMMMMR